MIRADMRWPLLAVLLLYPLVGGCAGRGERSERPAPEAAPEELVEVAPPLAPRFLRCTADPDCRLTQLPHPIPAVADCYCPECPRPLSSEVAAEHEEAWQRLCAGAWEEARRCLAPMCSPLPGAVACIDGRCGFAPVH